ncbi:hypothetical protein AB205_0190330 [Aquarana catesbeiana]|uniref:omega-amidase n=1 Tax=Aquarana catesbeiana TaxID=8400 RepID=A0A2G9RE22_AQUCT|nr:hypothetical protein AB205_0190330 [Aquarana catesbeiana]
MQAARAMAKFRLSLVQLFVSPVKADNLKKASELIKQAAQQGAQIVALPVRIYIISYSPYNLQLSVSIGIRSRQCDILRECFNSPYGTKFFPEYAEKIPGQSTQMLSEVAKECGIYLIGGLNENLITLCALFLVFYDVFWSPCTFGTLWMVHLFNIDVPGKIRFQESETLTPGESFSVFDTPYCKIGVGICYDIRFAELAQIYTKKGCQLLVYPGAFNMTTGPAHWELLQRARALDNQVYVATVSPARDEKASYIAWGHSTVVSPWGEVIAKAGADETIISTDIDLQYLADIRQQIPIHSQRRHDLYSVEEKPK